MTSKGLKVQNSNGQTFNLAHAQTYNNEGKVVTSTNPGGLYTYTYDSMGRPIKLTDNQSTPVDWVKDVVYGVAGELTQIKYWNPASSTYYTESRTYNNRLQLTRLTVPGAMDMEYRYSSTQNNGQITQQKDWVSGEEVTYAYDSLQRMISAVTTGPEWGQSFSYDGFGNLTAQTVTKGTVPSMSVNIEAATNRIASSSGGYYDANGNAVSLPNVTGILYDIDNRMVSALNERYGYGPDNKRVWKYRFQNQYDYTEEFFFYGIGGQKLGTWTIQDGNFTTLALADRNLYFGGKMILSKGVVPFLDRLGSNRNGSKYFPYGQEQTVTAQNKDKFATYYRDQTTGLDYAQNRYYANTLGRFSTPDPYGSGAKAADPGSWNRYAYVQGDPVNYVDSAGLLQECPPGTVVGADGKSCVPREMPEPIIIWPGFFDRVPDAPEEDPSVTAARLSLLHANMHRLEKSMYRVWAIEAKTDCLTAIGADSIGAVEKALKMSIGFEDLFAISIVNGKFTSQSRLAQYSNRLLGQSITFNNAVNWEDPNQTAGHLDGQLTLLPLLDWKAMEVGSASMTAEQFMDLTLLHELAHSFGIEHPIGSSSSVDKRIWESCLK